MTRLVFLALVSVIISYQAGLCIDDVCFPPSSPVSPAAVWRVWLPVIVRE